MEAKFSLLETKFLKLETDANSTCIRKTEEFNLLNEKIINSSDYLKIFIDLRLNEKRSYLLEQIRADLCEKIGICFYFYNVHF